MIREILLALCGHPGNIIRVDDENKTFFLSKDVAFIAAPDRALINRLCKIGYQYKHIKQFTTTHAFESRSPFIRSLCLCLDTILDEYLETVLRMEKQTYQDPDFSSVTRLRFEFQKYEQLFTELVKLTLVVEDHGYRGGRLITWLHRASNHGAPIVRTSFHRLLHACHGVLFKQLVAWCIHGVLGASDDFFIRDTHAARTDECAPGFGGGKSGDEALPKNDEKADPPCDAALQADTWTRYTLAYEEIPTTLGVSTAESLLFIGRAVHILNSWHLNSTAARPTPRLGDYPSCPIGVLSSRTDETDASRHPADESADASSASAADLRTDHAESTLDTLGICSQDEERWTGLLAVLLDCPTFRSVDLERAVSEVRCSAAQMLWTLLVTRSRLFDHLQAFKDFFLLGRGDFHQCLIEESRVLLQVAPGDNAEKAFIDAYQRAAQRCSLDDDAYFQFFGPCMLSRDQLQPCPLPTLFESWEALSLEYRVPWPLHLLFTSEAVRRYNTLFRFLFCVKRLQMELQSHWAIQTRMQGNNRLMPAWALRHQMSFFLDNLQGYLLADVIEPEFHRLMKRMRACTDYEDAKRAHEQYVSELHAQCFLNTTGKLRMIWNTIKELLQLCAQFCRHQVRQQSDINLKEIQHLESTFQRNLAFLFTVFKSLPHAPSLARLLLRLDFNGFVSRIEGTGQAAHLRKTAQHAMPSAMPSLSTPLMPSSTSVTSLPDTSSSLSLPPPFASARNTLPLSRPAPKPRSTAPSIALNPDLGRSVSVLPAPTDKRAHTHASSDSFGPSASASASVSASAPDLSWRKPPNGA
eukprot:gnl/Trimastix_PCT/1279.p1 GENE.gnl/Trimastix_PCT/1279~~gnl/Trimastix_PCT/1279.p1  ORF type:complete len:808 (+),score=172.10 gnl/Trimastix_PCT/1279:856-3279(+)